MFIICLPISPIHLSPFGSIFVFQCLKLTNVSISKMCALVDTFNNLIVQFQHIWPLILFFWCVVLQWCVDNVIWSAQNCLTKLSFERKLTWNTILGLNYWKDPLVLMCLPSKIITINNLLYILLVISHHFLSFRWVKPSFQSITSLFSEQQSSRWRM